MIHKQISNYIITCKIGIGEMSTIYEAKSIDDETKKVVIKVFSQEAVNNKDIVKKFADKAKIIQKLNHIYQFVQIFFHAF